MNQLLSPHIKTKAELTSPSSGAAPKKAKKSPSAPKEKKPKEKSAATAALAAVADPQDPFGRAVKKRAKARSRVWAVGGRVLTLPPSLCLHRIGSQGP